LAWSWGCQLGRHQLQAAYHEPELARPGVKVLRHEIKGDGDWGTGFGSGGAGVEEGPVVANPLIT
jgi:hypothetical protein